MCAEALVPNARTPRIPAVDLMRGVTIAAMIVVNNPGSWVHMLGSLAHASWGAVPAPADFVFPFFLFLVGVATPLALARRVREGHQRRALLGRAVRRAAGTAMDAVGRAVSAVPPYRPGLLYRGAEQALPVAAGFVRGVAAPPTEQ